MGNRRFGHLVYPRSQVEVGAGSSAAVAVLFPPVYVPECTNLLDNTVISNVC